MEEDAGRRADAQDDLLSRSDSQRKSHTHSM